MASTIQPLPSNSGTLIGQLAYERSSRAFSKTIQNLSTGIRINSGRDDPSGFISSTTLDTEIATTKQAIENCQRSNQLLSVVDSALKEVNNLMIDLRGYVTQAANTGVEDESMIQSLQLQVDATLDAIDRIANLTTFQGQKLLDGSLDFTTFGLDHTKAANLEIHSANFNGATEKDVSFKVLNTASQGVLFYQYGAALQALTLQISGKEGAHVFRFDQGADIGVMADAINLFSDATGVAASISMEPTKGMLGLSSAGIDNDIILSASKPGTDEGNFVVKYIAPPEGNDDLSLNFTRSFGTEPNEIEVVLRTQKFSAPVFHAEAENDGVANNEFDIVGKVPNSQLNDLAFTIQNVFGTAEIPGIKADFEATPKTAVISIYNNPNDPNDPNNTAVNDLNSWIKADPVLNTYLEVRNTNKSDGSGAIQADGKIVLNKPGLEGGKVLTTAAEVVSLLNNSPLLKDSEGNGLVNAVLPTGTTGLGTVTPFTEYAYYGDISTQNAIQFLGPQDSPNIRFVSEPGTPLSIDDTTFPAIFGKSEATIQGLDPGTSFTLRARSIGSTYDGMAVLFEDSPEESAIIDSSRNAVVFSIDFTGRDADPNRAPFNMNDLNALVARDPFLSKAFEVIPLQAFDPSDPPEFSHSDYIGIDAQMGDLDGGVVQPPVLLVHLETDSTGQIRTTANDLVAFFDNPNYQESQAILKKYGISASIMNLPNAALNNCFIDPSLNGFGVLQPSYDINQCVGEQIDGPYKEVVFTSAGLDMQDDYANVRIESKNGISSSFVVSAKKPGAEFNNTTFRIVADPKGPNIAYNADTKVVLIGVDPSKPPTANEVISLINSDPATRETFHADRQMFSDGSGPVAIGDQGRMTGGVHEVGRLAETVTTAINGIDAAFSITAKKADPGLAGVVVQVGNDPNGPNIVYDPLSKELAIGLNPLKPMTAQEVVDLINADPNVSAIFGAAIPFRIPGTLLMPDGSGIVSVGDFGVLQMPPEGTPKGAPMTNNSDSQNTGLAIYSVDYGSSAFVSIQPLLGSTFPAVDQFGFSKERQYGTDVAVLINKEVCNGIGNTAAVHTTDLDLEVTIDPHTQTGEVFGVRITGGGALMQLGPEASPLQQARISLMDLHTAKLGGLNGWLAELRSGGSKDLLTDTKAAFRVVEEVTVQITELRGRIGSFQKTQLEVGISQMLDITEISSSALSDVRDTDFAAESSLMTRLQILMEGTISVLKRGSENERMLVSLLQQ